MNRAFVFPEGAGGITDDGSQITEAGPTQIGIGIGIAIGIDIPAA
jgi:hypothetical protein